jgi:hypothetical protein
MNAIEPAPFSTKIVPYRSNPHCTYKIEWCTRGAFDPIIVDQQLESFFQDQMTPPEQIDLAPIEQKSGAFRVPAIPKRKRSIVLLSRSENNPASPQFSLEDRPIKARKQTFDQVIQSMSPGDKKVLEPNQ